MTVAAHVCDNLDALKPAASAALAENLKVFSTSPRRIDNRIRLVRKSLRHEPLAPRGEDRVSHIRAWSLDPERFRLELSDDEKQSAERWCRLQPPI